MCSTRGLAWHASVQTQTHIALCIHNADAHHVTDVSEWDPRSQYHWIRQDYYSFSSYFQVTHDISWWEMGIELWEMGCLTIVSLVMEAEFQEPYCISLLLYNAHIGRISTPC